MRRKLFCWVSTTFLLLLLTVNLVLFFSNFKSWTRYPKPAIYPGAVDISKSEPLIPDRISRITTYEVETTPDDVFIFYAGRLQKDGWEPDLGHPVADVISFGYLRNGASGPAYSLWVKAVQDLNGKTKVKLTQNISGPFSWPDNDW